MWHHSNQHTDHVLSGMCHTDFRRCVVLWCTALLCIYNVSVAQNIKRIDSLRLIEENALNDTLRLQAILDISVEIYLVNPDSSLIRARQALVSAQSMKYDRGIAEAHRVYGLSLQRTGQLSHSIREFLLAVEYYTSNNDSAGLLRSYNSLGLAASQSGSMATALMYYNKALQYVRPNESSLPSLYNNMSIWYLKTHDVKMSYHYADLAVQNIRANGLTRALPFALLAKAEASAMMGLPDSASKFAEEAQTINSSLNNTLITHLYYKTQGAIAFQTQQYGASLEYYKMALDAARRSFHMYFVRDTYRAIIRVADHLRLSRVSLAYQDSLDVLHNSLRQIEQASRIEGLNKEIQHLEHLSDMHSTENKILWQRGVLVAVIFLIALSVVLGGILIRASRTERSTHTALQAEANRVAEQKVHIEQRAFDVAEANARLGILNDELLQVNTRLEQTNAFKFSMMRLLSNELKTSMSDIEQTINALDKQFQHWVSGDVSEVHHKDAFAVDTGVDIPNEAEIKRIHELLQQIMDEVDAMDIMILRQLDSTHDDMALMSHANRPAIRTDSHEQSMPV